MTGLRGPVGMLNLIRAIVGIIISDSTFSSNALIVTDTYLYGITGFYRSLDMLQASLTYNIVNSYLGLTGSYKHGRDEDSAVSSQVWTIGLTGRF